MKPLRGTLVSDGSSDQMLFPILRWLLQKRGFFAVELSRPNLGLLPKPPKSLIERIQAAIVQSPCDVVFIHRDAEALGFEVRVREIERDLQGGNFMVPYVRIVPVRMSEAWLLIEESAIRKVAQKPHGRTPLTMPSLSQLESLPDPKRTLLELLMTASECKGRRLDQLKSEARSRVHQLAEFISDFSPLRNLSAFRELEAELGQTLSGFE